MKTQSPFVRADSAVKFYAKTSVYLHLTMVINPRNPKHDLPFRFHQPLYYTAFHQVWMLINNWLQ
jgi:hypothetical protein